MNRSKKDKADVFHSWWIFTKERFPPASYGPMVAAFVYANGVLACHLYESSSATPLAWTLAAISTLSFFFRLRLFDEIKDYETDLKVNPTRPLARGLLSIPQLKKMIVFCCVLELVLASLRGSEVVAAHTVAMAYSFLMYKEFFIGRWLRPHLTTYAVTHTAISVLVGLSAGSFVTGRAFWNWPNAALLAFVFNWGLFNLFEFARKTYAPEEERPHVESYSKLFRPAGALLLSLSQVLLALWIFGNYAHPQTSLKSLWALSLLCAIPGVVYAVAPRTSIAKVFRGLTGIYLVLAYLGFALVARN